MNIFLVCNKSPYPPKEGGPIAMNAIIQGLVDAGHSVKVLAINTNKYKIAPEEIPDDFRRNTKIELEYIDLSIKPFDAFLNLFTGRSYHVQRFISAAFESRLIEILKSEKFDIIQFETLYITPYINTIRKYSKAKIVLRAHNIEHLIWNRVARATRNPFKKLYVNHLAKTLRKYELTSLDRFDGIATITAKDGKFLKQFTKTPIISISFGINLKTLPEPSSDYEFPSLFHIGSMNWIPNIEGIKWFIEKVWPPVSEKYPDLKFYLAGREMPEWLLNIQDPNIIVPGEVDDAYAFINSKAIMIVPLLSGSGIRIKIIEGMALGKAIISTKIGAEGIQCVNGESILFAESPDDYVEAISRCVESARFTSKLGSNARHLISSQHNNEKIIKRLVKFYQEIL